MAHIELTNQLPGIAGLLKQFPRTAKPLMELAQELLRGPSTLTEGERETIAAFVSSRNECRYCAASHGAAARHLLGRQADLVDEVIFDLEGSRATPKLKALLAIAGEVRDSGRSVAAADIERARKGGASEQEIHDTVLIAAAFSMYNRYVDGLATWAPADDADYVESGRLLAEQGYIRDR